LGGLAAWKLRTPPIDKEPILAALPSATPVPPIVDAGKACPGDMILIEGGQFYMGSATKSMMGNEGPEHQVTLNAYCIDKHEVSVDYFVSCTKIGKCRFSKPENDFGGITPAQHKLYDPVCNLTGAENGSTVPDGKGKYPINCVSWDDARNFCEQMGFRLPSEAEWEHAARGSDGRVYPWAGGDPGPDLLNGCGAECVAWGKKNPDPENPLKAMYAGDDGFATTAPVGSYPKGASVYGLQDMTGNVWEWVADYYADYPAEWETTTQSNPKGPASGENRVMRGGAWNSSDKSWMRPSFRFHAPPKQKAHGIGFRCAGTPK
jgi:formylglycine-generating enzyme required for sulfatase activity